MAGHSKWSKVKRLKGALDVKRGKLFSKISKEITIAAKLGGGNPSSNPRLRAAIQTAKSQSMPNDNIERAIKKGTGELTAATVEEILYEGYAPGGVAFLVEAATDNKNRTAADLRAIFSRQEGNLGGPGSVSYLFHRKGQILVSKSDISETKLFETALEAGAEELLSDESFFTLYTLPEQLYAVAEVLRQTKISIESQKLTYLPQNTVYINDEHLALRILNLYDALEDCDDVLSIHSNFDIPEGLLPEHT
ncbi:MAG: YebC/PmpR family DNA-binding transcriptional regulator [Verrucomicrobia bacterium]|nr:MAG: YebC/PmpR family DNA-binding transcriptional regulator [Verrucomicrobiota bacterium]